MLPPRREGRPAPTRRYAEEMTVAKKSTFQAEPSEANSAQLDPLIDALLDHLPAPGDPFPPEERALWMQILDLILKLIHPDEAPEQPGQPEQPTPQ